MTDFDREIAELEAALRALKRIRKSQRISAARKAAWADPAVRAKMSAARKAAWAEKYEAELAPKRKRESRKGLGDVPQDAFAARLFGKRK